MRVRSLLTWSVTISTAWASLVGCGRPDDYDTLFRLDERLSLAEIHHEIELLDLGTDRARQALGTGWSWNERSGDTTYVWGLAPESWVHFHSSQSRPIELTFRCRPLDVDDASAQVVEIAINSLELQSVRLEPGLREYQVSLPVSAVRPGRNTLKLGYGYASSPYELGGSSDRRPLAVAWDWIRLDLEPPSQAPSAGTDAETLSIPAGHLIDFYFFAHPGDRLVIDTVDNPDPARIGFEIDYRDDHMDREHPLDVGDLISRRQVTLPVFDPTPARLRLRAFARDGRNRTGTPIVLRRGRIETKADRRPDSAPSANRIAELPEIDRPDILIYLVDTLRADRIGSQGGRRELTPAIDRLAAQAILFERAIAPSSWTKPSVTSLLTGLRPFAHGVNHRRHRLGESFVTLAEIVADLGYVTAGFATNPYLSAASGLHQGFDHFDLSNDPTEVVIDRVLGWLRDTDRTQPRLLYVHTVEPHDPYAPPEEFRRRFAAAVSDPEIGSAEHIRQLGQRKEERTEEVVEAIESLYDAEVAYGDRQFGRLMEGLRRSGSYDDTLIVFLSDHGESFYEHGVMGHGWDLYREVTHVPLIVRLPAQRFGLRIDSAVPITDVVPTVLDVLRVEPMAPLSGRSLLVAPPALRQSGSTPIGSPIYSYLDYDGRRGISVILGRWKLIEPVSSSFLPQRKLFDLVEDPSESRDLSPRYPATAGWLATLAREQLQALEGRPAAERVEFDEATERQLRALGYLD